MSLMPNRKPPGLKDGCFGPSQYPEEPWRIARGLDKDRDRQTKKMQKFLLSRSVPDKQGRKLPMVYLDYILIERPETQCHHCACGAFFMDLNFRYDGPRRILDGAIVRSGLMVAKIRFCTLCATIESLEADEVLFNVKDVDLAEILR